MTLLANRELWSSIGLIIAAASSVVFGLGFICGRITKPEPDLETTIAAQVERYHAGAL